MEILNLDGYAEVTRQLTLDGVKHDIVETTVQEFVNNLAAAEAIEALTMSDVEATRKGVDLSVNSIHQAVPSLSEERIRKLNLNQMSVVLKFLRGDLDPKEDPKAAPGKGGAEAKKG